MCRLRRLVPGFDRGQGFPGTVDLGQDDVGGFGPYERRRHGVVVCKIGADGCLKVGDAFEDTAANGILGDRGEEPLDQIEPRRRGGNEVQLKALVPLQPVLDLLGLMRRIVVEDEVQIERPCPRRRRSCSGT